MGEAHDPLAQQAAVFRIGDLRRGHQGHFTVVVDTGVPRQHARRQFPQHRHEPHVARFIGQVPHELLQQHGVFGPDRTQQPFLAILAQHRLHETAWIGMDGHMAVGPVFGPFAVIGRIQSDPDVPGIQLGVIPPERVDRQGAQPWQFADDFRDPLQRFAQLFEYGRTEIAFEHT